MSDPPRRQRIRVPTRMVQGGFDFKFETDSYDVKLHGILSPQEYTDVITNLNYKLKPSRSNSIDGALLVAGPLLVPLALWGARHGLQTRKRKRLLKQAIEEFNETHPGHWMRWNRGGPESFLTIERRQSEEAPMMQQHQHQTALVPVEPLQTNPHTVAAHFVQATGSANPNLAVAEASLL